MMDPQQTQMNHKLMWDGAKMILTKNELKILKEMEDKERKRVLLYTYLWIAVLIGVFFVSIGIILNEANLKIIGLIAGLPGMMAILAIRKQLKLFRTIKKLQKGPGQDQQKAHAPETE
jgi:hypothetical protein